MPTSLALSPVERTKIVSFIEFILSFVFGFASDVHWKFQLSELSQEFLYNFWVLDAGQALIQSLELDREAFVVDAKAVQNCRVDVIDVHRIRDDVVTEVVGFSVHLATFDSAASHPHAEISRMVITSVVVFGERSL